MQSQGLGVRERGSKTRIGESEQRGHDKLATDTGSWLPHSAESSQELYGM